MSVRWHVRGSLGADGERRGHETVCRVDTQGLWPLRCAGFLSFGSSYSACAWRGGLCVESTHSHPNGPDSHDMDRLGCDGPAPRRRPRSRRGHDCVSRRHTPYERSPWLDSRQTRELRDVGGASVSTRHTAGSARVLSCLGMHRTGRPRVGRLCAGAGVQLPCAQGAATVRRGQQDVAHLGSPSREMEVDTQGRARKCLIVAAMQCVESTHC